MLPLNPFAELGRVDFDDFFSMPISTEFSQPIYYIGQIVLHKIQVPEGEILYPVKVRGIFWMGDTWEYDIELPEYHRWYIFEDREIDHVEGKSLEAM